MSAIGGYVLGGLLFAGALVKALFGKRSPQCASDSESDVAQSNHEAAAKAAERERVLRESAADSACLRSVSSSRPTPSSQHGQPISASGYYDRGLPDQYAPSTERVARATRPASAAPVARAAVSRRSGGTPPPPAAPLAVPGRWVLRAQFPGNKSFGFYACSSCGRTWVSAHAWKKYTEGCKGCEQHSYPLYMWHNEGKRDPDRPVRKADAEKPHDQARCGKCRKLAHACWIRDHYGDSQEQ